MPPQHNQASTTQCTFEDRGSCSARFIRMTMNQIPTSYNIVALLLCKQSIPHGGSYNFHVLCISFRIYLSSLNPECPVNLQLLIKTQMNFFFLLDIFPVEFTGQTKMIIAASDRYRWEILKTCSTLRKFSGKQHLITHTFRWVARLCRSRRWVIMKIASPSWITATTARYGVIVAKLTSILFFPGQREEGKPCAISAAIIWRFLGTPFCCAD